MQTVRPGSMAHSLFSERGREDVRLPAVLADQVTQLGLGP